MTVSVPRIEKLLAELQEPWRTYGDQILDRHDDLVCECAEQEDAALICEAVNALPALIVAAKAAQEYIAEIRPCPIETNGLPCQSRLHPLCHALAPFSFEEQA